MFKQRIRLRHFWLLAIASGVALLVYHEWHLLPDGRLHLSFLDIGQGDAELIVTPSGRQILIDGGPDLAALEHLGTRLPFFDRSIDLLVLTHPHLDHLASFPEILKRYRVGSVVLTGVAYDLPRYQGLLETITTNRTATTIIDGDRTLDFGDGVELHFLWPEENWIGRTARDVHDSSLVLQLTFKNHTALFTGDMEEKSELEMIRAGLPIDSDILKIGHHGSITSSSEEFLRAVSPDLAVLSIGEGNRYGHPRQEVLDRLTEQGILYKRTDRDGTVEVVW